MWVVVVVVAAAVNVAIVAADDADNYNLSAFYSSRCGLSVRVHDCQEERVGLTVVRACELRSCAVCSGR